MKQSIVNLPLKELARLYLESLKQLKKDLKIIENCNRVAIDGKKKIPFDFIMKDEATGEIIGVRVKDWKRVIGVNVIHQFARDIEKAGLSYGILIGSDFSRIGTERKNENIILLSRGEIISYLRSLGYD